MNISKANYPRYADARAPRSSLVRDCVRAFACGGAICAIGEVLNKVYGLVGLDREDAGLLCSVTLVFVAVLLTGIGVFDRIARFAGAGTLVPITGFANAVVSQAIDTKAEGWILGIGAKIFTISGPVILYGTLASVLYGVILYLTRVL